MATYNSTGTTVQSIALNPTEIWESGHGRHLPGAGTFNLIEHSDNRWLPLPNSFWATFQFETLVPVGATIVSTKIYVEHWESNGFKEGDFIWEIGIGTLSDPTVLGSTIAANLNGLSNEAIVEWDVTPWIFASTEANDLKLKVINNSTNGKKVNLDHIYVIVEYIQ